MPWGWLADLVLLLHAGFALFVAGGAFLVRRWPRLAWLHLPAAAWGVLIEWTGGTCPLTPLEAALRRRAGEAGYTGDFLGHYLLAWLYPEGLTREAQFVIGAGALAVNVALYAAILRRRARTGRAT